MQIGESMPDVSRAPSAITRSPKASVAPKATPTCEEHDALDTKDTCISLATPVSEMWTCSTARAPGAGGGGGGAGHAGGAHCDSACAPAGEQSPAGHGFIFS